MSPQIIHRYMICMILICTAFVLINGKCRNRIDKHEKAITQKCDGYNKNNEILKCCSDKDCIWQDPKDPAQLESKFITSTKFRADLSNIESNQLRKMSKTKPTKKSTDHKVHSLTPKRINQLKERTDSQYLKGLRVLTMGVDGDVYEIKYNADALLKLKHATQTPGRRLLNLVNVGAINQDPFRAAGGLNVYTKRGGTKTGVATVIQSISADPSLINPLTPGNDHMVTVITSAHSIYNNGIGFDVARCDFQYQLNGMQTVAPYNLIRQFEYNDVYRLWVWDNYKETHELQDDIGLIQFIGPNAANRLRLGYADQMVAHAATNAIAAIYKYQDGLEMKAMTFGMHCWDAFCEESTEELWYGSCGSPVVEDGVLQDELLGVTVGFSPPDAQFGTHRNYRGIIARINYERLMTIANGLGLHTNIDHINHRGHTAHVDFTNYGNFYYDYYMEDNEEMNDRNEKENVYVFDDYEHSQSFSPLLFEGVVILYGVILGCVGLICICLFGITCGYIIRILINENKFNVSISDM